MPEDNQIGEDTAVPNVDAATVVATTLTSPTDPAIPHLIPDDTVQPSMGSSRFSGGILCGHALGNVLNHADFSAMTLDFETPVKGEVYLYVTDQYPHYLNFELLKGESELVVIVKVVGSMAPILHMVARKFSVIQSECI
jgi:hypothetical protein